MLFVDLKRAYDSINRQQLWDALVNELKLPVDFVQILRNMYVNSKGIIEDAV
jgi:RNAse (barnase) inhibitor barstar